jgi:hypothetical protein
MTKMQADIGTIVTHICPTEQEFNQNEELPEISRSSSAAQIDSTA